MPNVLQYYSALLDDGLWYITLVSTLRNIIDHKSKINISFLLDGEEVLSSDVVMLSNGDLHGDVWWCYDAWIGSHFLNIVFVVSFFFFQFICGGRFTCSSTFELPSLDCPLMQNTRIKSENETQMRSEKWLMFYVFFCFLLGTILLYNSVVLQQEVEKRK